MLRHAILLAGFFVSEWSAHRARVQLGGLEAVAHGRKSAADRRRRQVPDVKVRSTSSTITKIDQDEFIETSPV